MHRSQIAWVLSIAQELNWQAEGDTHGTTHWPSTPCTQQENWYTYGQLKALITADEWLLVDRATKHKSLLTLLLFLLLSISHELSLAKLHWSFWATCCHCWCAAIHSPYCWSHWQRNGMERWNHSCHLHCQTIAPITVDIDEIYNQWLILVQGLYLCWLAMFWIHKKLSVICSYRRLTVWIMAFDTHTYVPTYIHLISVGLTQACPNNLLNHLDVTRDYMRKKKTLR